MTTPTLIEVRQAYVTYADYEETGSQADCRAFITACRRLLVMLPSASTGTQQTSQEFDVALVQKQLDAARVWLASHPSDTDAAANPDVIHFDFSEFSR